MRPDSPVLLEGLSNRERHNRESLREPSHLHGLEQFSIRHHLHYQLQLRLEQFNRRERRSVLLPRLPQRDRDRKSTRLNSSHLVISYAVFCLKKKNEKT